MNHPGYHHLSWTDRLTIEKMRRIKTPVAQIAEALGFSRKTIYNELHRGEVTLLASDLTTYQAYSPDIAEQKYRAMLRDKHRDLAIGHDHAQVRELERLIKDEHWSPAPALAACSGRFTARISISTLYNYIYRGDVFLRLTPSDLHDKGRRRRRHRDDKPARPPRGTSIEKRPEEIGQRGTFGHWEMDSVMGKVGSQRALLVLTERLTRTGILRLLPGTHLRRLSERWTRSNATGATASALCSGRLRWTTDASFRTPWEWNAAAADAGRGRNCTTAIRRVLMSGAAMKTTTA